MESKTVLRNLIDQTIQGNFDYVFSYISSLKKPLEENNAIKFIIACCNACNNNLSTPSNLKEEDLVKLLKCLLTFIKTPLREHCDSYLQSVFFIIKLLYEKKSIKCIIQLEELLIPEFMPLVFTDKQATIYENICKIMYNSIVKIGVAKEKKYRPDILKMCCLLCLLYKKGHNLNKLLDGVHNCLIMLVNLNVNAQELLEFYSHYLNLLDERDVSAYNLLINNFSYLYTTLLKIENFQAAETCYISTHSKIKQIFKSKEHTLLEEILEFVRWMNPICSNNSIEIVNSAHNTLKNCYQQFRTMNNLQAICDVISSVVSVVLQYYKNVNSTKWLEKPIEVHLEFYKFLYDVSHIMSKTPYQCHCKSCPTKTNLNEALRTLDSMTGFGRLFISKNSTVPRNYKIDILRYLEKLTEHVATLKQNNCGKWRNYWYNAGVHLYSIGLNLQDQKDFEMCALFMKKFVEKLINFEGTEPVIIEKTYLTSAFSVIADSFLEMKDYEKSLLIIACAMSIGSDLIIRWIRTKVSCRESTIMENEELQELTLVSVCEKHQSELATYFPNKKFEINKKKKIELLIHELNNYRMKWKSKVPMMAAYRHLSQIADSTTAAKVFIEIWGDCDLKVHDCIPKLLQTTIKNLELDTIKTRSIQVKFYLSYLYFLQHKYRVKDVIIKHCDEMEKTMNMSKMANQIATGPVPPDPNDECDIVSSYDCLKLARYLVMIKDLNKSLDTILELFAENIEKLAEKDKLYKLLIKIGHEYNLHSFIAKSLQAFELALRLAKLDDDKVNILQVASFIIEIADVTKPSIKKLVQEVESIIFSFLSEKSNLEELIVYYLCKSEAYFYVDFDTAYTAFRQASKLRENLEESSILKARLYLLHFKFIMLPCEFNIEGHEEYSLVRIHQAYNHAIKHYTESLSLSSYDLRIFFEICENLVKLYYNMRLPREMRCYGKEVVLIAQKVVLPLRTSTMLYYLANADLLSCRLDDCRVKVDGVSDILCLSKCKTLLKNPSSVIESKKFDELDDLSAEFGEIMLDVPARHSKPNSMGSPSFKAETFHLPSFLKHEDSCDCFYCTWMEYHQHVLKNIYLHALLYEYEGNLTFAKDFFFGCMKMYECWKGKQRNYLSKMSKKMPEDLVPLPRINFLEIKCRILLDYANFFLRSEKIKEADNINRKIMEKMEPFSLHSVYLYNEILVQRLNIYGETVMQNNEPKKKETSIEDLDTIVVIKTPELKQSKVTISPEHSPGYVEIVKMFPKSLQFDLSDEDENSESKKITTGKNIPSFLTVPKTPAPSSSKIKIYTNTKSTKKKKVLDEVPPSKNARALDFLIPASPEAYTPNSVRGASKVDHNLANRTKLLTERLKSSTRKCPKVVVTEGNDGKECSSKNGTETIRRRVRQNLLSQLESTENGDQHGAIRRSGRNKK